MELHKSAGTLPELGSPVLGATRALPFPLLLALTASFPGRRPGRASGQAARGPAGRRAHERRPGARPGLWTWLQRAGSGRGQGVTRPRHVGCASSRPVPRALAPPGARPGGGQGGHPLPPEAAREMSVQGTAPPASGTRAARGRGVQPTPGDRAASPGRCSRGPPRSTGTPASPCARAVPSNSRPGSAGRKDAVSLGLYRRGSRGLARSLSRGRRRRAGTPAGRRALSPGLPRAGRAPLTAVPPAGRQRPQTREADSPGPPAAGGRQGSPTPDPAPGGVLRGTERRLSARVTIRAHTGRGARGDAALGLGTSSRCAGAPGRFKPGSQARPPAPTTPPRGGWTGPAPVDSHSSLSPRDLGTRGRSPSSLSLSV